MTIRPDQMRRPDGRPLTALFLGNPSITPAAVVARWLVHGHNIAAFWTADEHHAQWRRDRWIRRVAPQWSTALRLAKAKVPIIAVPRLTGWPEAAAQARASGADVLICCYFPFLIPVEILDLFPGRAFNLHPALLPRYRGPTPWPAMIVDRETEASGVTLHLIDKGLDTGDIVAQTPLPFREDGSLRDHELRTAYAAARLTDAIPDYLIGRIEPRKQDETVASYRKARQRDFVISSDLTLDEASWRCRMMPSILPPSIGGLPGCQTVGLSRVLGRPTGKPPRLGWLTADIDIADARIRLRLRKSGWRRWQRWKRLAMLRRAVVVED